MPNPIPVSTVPTAIANLTSQIATAAAGDSPPSGTPILIIAGEETTDAPADLIIVATNVTRTVTEEAFMGDLQTGTLEERYWIDILCSSWSGDPDPVLNMNRAWQLVGYVEKGCRTDPSLGSDVLIARPAGTRGGQSFWSEPPIGRQCDIICQIFVDTLN